ncbi:MAG: hypothetical protein KF691_01160 [Phycisphaeraceae bacterium]|nr:hypothetical protein [Phycisphaeraceae bacterium]
MRAMVVGVAALSAGGAFAASVTNLPFNPPGSTRITLANKFAGAIGGGTNDSPLNDSARTLEWVFRGSQVSMMAPGTRLVGASFRNTSVNAGPSAQADFADWSLTLSRSLRAPGALSSVVADNAGADALAVRSGALTVSQGEAAAKSGALPAPFTFGAVFQSAFEYSGGNLHLLLSHSGSGVGGVSFDAASPGDPDTNALFQARKANSAGAAMTTQAADTPVTRLSTDAGVSLPLLTANASNGSAGFVGALGASGFAGQFVIGAEQLKFVPRGSLITWLAFRMAPGDAAWPSADVTTSDFEIEVATSVNPPQQMATFFGGNPAADAILVRQGALTIEAGAFAAGAGEIARFGAPIHFQRGFVYTGGDLCVTVRHAPFSGAGPRLDTANPASALRTSVASASDAQFGAFLAQDASIALQIGFTPSLCVPTSVEKESGGSGAWLFETPRVHQLVIDPSQLTYLPVGSTVDGIAFRISPVAPLQFVSWPQGDATVNQFDVYLSTAQRTASTMSEVFAQNEGADRVLNRSGSLFVPSEAMKVIGGTVAEHSFIVPFTRPFVYTGGGVCITMRVGQRIGGGAAVNFDGKFNTFGVNGRRNTVSSTATSANTGGALAFATRLVFTRPAPTCAADLNADGLVDDLDFVLFVGAYEFLTTPAADFNYDGMTDDGDFPAFALAYDALVCP